MGPGASPFALPESTFPYDVTLLFFIYAAIAVSWDALIGILTFVLDGVSHLRNVLIERLKEELLALGIVSLVLVFVTSFLEKETLDTKCPPGHAQLFPGPLSISAHFLLFWIAIIQIFYTLLGVMFTTLRFHRLQRYEQAARRNAAAGPLLGGSAGGSLELSILPAGSADSTDPTFALPGAATKPSTRGRSCGSAVYGLAFGSLDEQRYELLRTMLVRRIAADHHAHSLATMNLAVASEQLVHKEIGAVHAHTWLQITVMGLLLLYKEQVHTFVWAGPVAAVFAIWFALKLRSVLLDAAELIVEHVSDVPLVPQAHHQHAQHTSDQHAGPVALDATHQGNHSQAGGMVGSYSNTRPGTVMVDVSEPHPAGHTAHAHGDPRFVHKVEELERRVLRLFWFRNPHLLLWLLELILVVNAAVLTLSLFFLSTGMSKKGKTLDSPVFVALIISTLFVAFYLGWVVIPQYAVMTTAMTTELHEILHHMRWVNVLGEEHEHGFAGVTFQLLSFCRHGCRTRKRSARKQEAGSKQLTVALDGGAHGDADGDVHILPAVKQFAAKHVRTAEESALIKAAHQTLMDAWVTCLALRSGTILPFNDADAAHAYLATFAPVFMGLVKMWRLKGIAARPADGSIGSTPPGGFVMRGGILLTAFKEVFDSVDSNASGAVTGGELQAHMRGAFNVRPTNTELQAMILEVTPHAAAGQGRQDSGAVPGGKLGVTFLSFFAYAAFCFLDSNRTGTLNAQEITSISRAHGLELAAREVDAMMAVAGTGRGGQVTAPQFIAVFQGVIFLFE